MAFLTLKGVECDVKQTLSYNYTTETTRANDSAIWATEKFNNRHAECSSPIIIHKYPPSDPLLALDRSNQTDYILLEAG